MAVGNFIINAFNLRGLRPRNFDVEEVERGYMDAPVRQSVLGTPVFSNLDFLGFPADPDKGVPEHEGMRIDTVLLEVTRPRRIVVTHVDGRDDSIKEFISNGDWSITARGVLGGLTKEDSYKYPKEEFEKLKVLCEVPIPLEVASHFLNALDITEVVVTEPRFIQVEGDITTQLFQLEMISSRPLEELEKTSTTLAVGDQIETTPSDVT